MELSQVKAFAKAVQREGGNAFWVGGCVRDELLQIVPKDFDIEVFGLDAKQLESILQLFGTPLELGLSYSVYKMGDHLDISLPRREKKSGVGHKAFAIASESALSYEEACMRRDFTMNAILKNILTGEIIDPFGGVKDIRDKVIRYVSKQTFAEDSLRVLRAAQFASRLGFQIEENTKALCRTIDLGDLPKERIWTELRKLLLLSPKPSLGLSYLDELGVSAKLFPELHALEDIRQSPTWHPEGNVGIHTKQVVDQARQLINDLPEEKQITVMLASLLHDVGKALCTSVDHENVRALGHETAGLVPAVALLDRLGIFSLNGYDVRQQVLQLIRFHLIPSMWFKTQKVGLGSFRRLALKVDLDLLYRVAKADALGRQASATSPLPSSEAQEWFLEQSILYEVRNKPVAPLLAGKDLIKLGLKPSPQFSKLLNQAYEQQMDGNIVSKQQAIEFVKKLISNEYNS